MFSNRNQSSAAAVNYISRFYRDDLYENDNVFFTTGMSPTFCLDPLYNFVLISKSLETP